MARTVDSLGVQKQLNAMFEQRLNIETRILDTMQQELKVAMQIQAVMKGMSSDELVERLAAGSKAFEDMAEKAATSGDIGAESMRKVGEASEKSTGAVSGMSKAIGGIAATLKQVGSTALGIVGSMLRIGKAVGSIPLGIFKNLLNEAASFVGDTSFMQALENIRKEFGSFKEDVSKNIIGSFNTMNTELQAVTGLSVWRVFGHPAEQLKYLQEIASKAGAQMHQFGEEMARSAGKIAAFDKGMGIGAENLRSFMNRATVMGTDLTKQLQDTANYALQMGKAFGMSSKTLSRDVGYMMRDVKNFGSLTQKEMTVAAVYTRKLGLEVKELVGLIGQFDNFDKAAESAALLSQAFGASVDAFKMMNEQDPAKRLDELRKSMAATGKSTENMTRQELKLLAQTAGLSEEAAKLAFSTKNQGLSYDEVQKQATKAEDAQLKQADALKKLADNIERVVMQGQQMHGSFFKMFFAGFERGIKWSKEYMGAMFSLRRALHETYWAGAQVGRQFVASQEVGFGPFMKNFAATFSPQNVRKLMYGFKDASGKEARGVVAELNDVINGKQGFGTAVANIRAQFHKVVDTKTLTAMLDAGKQFMRFLAKGLGSASGFLAKELVSVFKTLTDFIKNPKEFLMKAGAAADGTKTFGAELIGEFTKSFGDPAVLKELKTAGFGLLKALGEAFMKLMKDPQVQEIVSKAGGALMTLMLGPAVLKMLPSLLTPVLKAVGRGLVTVGGGSLAAVAGVALAGAALVNVNKKMDQYEQNIDQRFAKTSRKVGAYGGSLIQGLTLGLLPDNLTQMLSNTIAEFADAVFDAITKTMGGPFTKKLQGYFSAHIDFLGSVGGLIGAIFSGDSAKISDAATKVGENFVTLVSKGFEFLITEFPKLVLKVGSVLQTLIGSLLSGFGQAIANLGDKIPIVGGVFKGFGIVLMGLGEVFKDLGRLTDWVFQKLKDFDISATLSRAFDELKLKFVDIGLSVLNTIPGPILTFLGLSDKGRESMRATLEKSRADITANMQRMAEEAAKAAEEARKKQEEAAKSATAQAAGAAPTPTASAAGPVAAQVKALEDFNEKLKAPAQTAMEITSGVTKSINELNEILGDGSKGAMQIGAKLKRFADSSGLGKHGTYEIKNKGIQLKLDLKVVMEAGEVEKAIVLRKESIIFDALFDKNPALTEEHQNSINQVNAMKGGG